MNAKRFDLYLLKTKTVGAKATPKGIEVTFAAVEEGAAGGTQALRPSRPKPTTWCCRRLAVHPTARRSPPTRSAWPFLSVASSTPTSRCTPEAEAKAQGIKVKKGLFPGLHPGAPLRMGAGAVDIGKTIHPHPTLGESIGMAAEVAHGSCTDLPSARKQAGLTHSGLLIQ